jgi:hypothetical protein
MQNVELGNDAVQLRLVELQADLLQTCTVSHLGSRSGHCAPRTFIAMSIFVVMCRTMRTEP